MGALKQGGTLKMSIDQWINQYNSNTADGSQGDAAAITGQVEPTLFLADARGVNHADTDYLLSAKVTSTSPQTVTYTLNPKARWSNGQQLSWRDFQAQWKALNGTNSAFQAADTSGYDQIASVSRGGDDRQAVVTFKNSYSDWQRLFNPLFPASEYSTPAKFNTGWVDHVPVSAGPYKIGNYDKTDQTITLVPDPKWWGAQPHLAKVIYRVLDISALTQAFLNKEIDIAPAQLPEDYQQLVKDKGAVIETGSPAGTRCTSPSTAAAARSRTSGCARPSAWPSIAARSPTRTARASRTRSTSWATTSSCPTSRATGTTPGSTARSTRRRRPSCWTRRAGRTTAPASRAPRTASS